MTTTVNSIPVEQQEKARTLLALAWHFSAKPQGTLTLGHYNALAKHIEDELFCTCCGKSIMRFVNSLDDGSLAGFKRNTTKETLAGYVLVKAGLTDEVEVVRGSPPDYFNHPVHKYWLMFEEYCEDLKKFLPHPMPKPSVSESSLFDIYRLEPVLPYYECTIWHVYSRARKGGIYRLVLTIEKEKIGHLNKVFMKNGSSGVEDYNGFVGMDSSKGFLVFNLVTCESMQKHLHLKLKVSRGTYPKCAVGQSNCISSVSSQIISDMVVFELAPKDLDIETAARYFSLGSKEYLELPICLRRYFHELERCRLHAPKTDITRLHHLEDWLEAQRELKRPFKGDKILLRLCDEYAVLYETPDSKIEQRFIRIYQDLNVAEVCAVAAPDYREKFRSADVYRYENTVTLIQTENVGDQTRTYQLSFKIHLDANAPEPWYYEGFAMGFWEKLNGSASRALVVRRNTPDFESRTKQLVRDFFWTTFQMLESQ